MLFCSQAFVLFFTAVFCVYWAMPWTRARVYLLLAASFYFYASWNRWLALIICVSTSVDFLLARGIEGSSSPLKRKTWLTCSIVANLTLLCYFKYANFFLQSLEEALHAAGATTSIPLLKVILPIGISFYTFEAINYMVDVYRGHVKAERNLANFMLFILFFPHLVAGPIVRSRDFLPQIQAPKRWDWQRFQWGVEFFLMGLFKKLAIADRMAQFADPVFADPAAYKTHAIWIAVIAYALQIYCDFSGYTDMALGTAHMLGYKLAQNFNMPYMARNISDFWRRWHISLSSWLRDYLFIPLGGSRGGRWNTHRNFLITMMLGGLWHGAAWTFVLWGLLHGALLIIHREFQAFSKSRPRLDVALRSPLGTAFCMALTCLCVAIGWVFFRATSFGMATTVLTRMFVPQGGLGAPLHGSGLIYTVLVVVACHVLGENGRWKKLSLRLPTPVSGFAYGAAATLALLLAPDMSKAFIYFQF